MSRLLEDGGAPQDIGDTNKESEPIGGKKKQESEEHMVITANQEPSTLLCEAERDGDGDCVWDTKNRESLGGEEGKSEEKRSVRSECVSLRAESRTESERELQTRGSKECNAEAEPQLKATVAKEEVEMEVEEENYLPEKAAQVFSLPASRRHSETNWDMETERGPFLTSHGYLQEWSPNEEPSKCACSCLSRDVLKLSVSFFTSALLFPFLVWGGYVFLPFDAPLLNGNSLRLLYTLRCAVFASVPIILGWLVLGVSRLRTGEVKPMFEGEVREVSVHKSFIADSISLFILYFLQLVVMAMYISQEQLKVVPLLTIIFALGRLMYWLTAALGSSTRGFGFGLSFLPSLAMLVANLYFIFTMDAAGSIYAQEGPPLPDVPPSTKQRFWG
ncbi:transmembrane protein 79 [Lampris incognitus]|uniref:transmembrane protein 79 n=1 Tax=Lampris incognitus TaxID=2546036 RepID=UPI0024B48D1E|nr:transmembrane protein 79 [Lampris incognitus]XP_056142536.1 transmembrane protein 79 [Lampris incognitus]XP_056142539.1 transmembrane protein 79 [Lampris incognitus]